MRRICIFCCLLFSAFSSIAGDGVYAVSKIPANLLKNANAVVRNEELRFEYVHSGKTVYRNHFVITILNENGDRWSYFWEYYDKLQKIVSVEGWLYDASGNIIKKMKTKDAEDISGVSEGSLIDDNRVKQHSFYHKVYPYTVEYDIEIERSHSFYFEPWSPLKGEHVSVEKSSYTLICPVDYEARFKTFNVKEEPVRLQKEKTKSIAWNVINLTAISDEPYSPLWHEKAPVIIFGPTDFAVDDYKGSMSSWKEFGKFVYALKKGRDVLPPVIKQKVHELADGMPDVRSKISVLYDYLQHNTRYISIQLGVGGWQPFDASYVAGKSYGDCKALTNYMFSLLKEAGINSSYTLVRSGVGQNYITEDFPSQQFNHVILCVPLQKDTVWLECTSQTLPAGYLSEFTANRPALMIDENGGTLVRTANYGIRENVQQRKIYAILQNDGTLVIKSETRYGGTKQDNIHGLINELSKDKVKEYLHEQLDFATYDISRFEYKEEKTELPSINESLDIVAANYASITGKRVFIIPNVMTRSNRRPADDPDRKFDVILRNTFQEQDSISIQLPAGYSAESIPSDQLIESKFGKYTSTTRLNGNELHYSRKFEFYPGRFPPSEYSNLVKYYAAIYKADRSKVVLVKAE